MQELTKHESRRSSCICTCAVESFPIPTGCASRRHTRASEADRGLGGGEKIKWPVVGAFHLISRQLECRKQPSQYTYSRLEDADHSRVVERQVIADPVPTKSGDTGRTGRQEGSYGTLGKDTTGYIIRHSAAYIDMLTKAMIGWRGHVLVFFF